MTKTNEQSEQVSPVKVTQPLWRRAARKTGKVLDWTVLPITEVKKLGSSVGLLGVFFKDAIKALIGLFNHTDKVSISDSKKKINTFRQHDLYFNALNTERKKMIEELPMSFFVKRTMSVAFCVVVCIFAFISALIGLYNHDFHIIRGTITILMLALLLGYTWLSITALENISYTYKRINFIDKSLWRLAFDLIKPACMKFISSVKALSINVFKNIKSLFVRFLGAVMSLFKKSSDGGGE